MDLTRVPRPLPKTVWTRELLSFTVMALVFDLFFLFYFEPNVIKHVGLLDRGLGEN